VRTTGRPFPGEVAQAALYGPGTERSINRHDQPHVDLSSINQGLIEVSCVTCSERWITSRGLQCSNAMSRGIAHEVGAKMWCDAGA